MALHGITWHAIAPYGMAWKRVALHGIILVVYQREPFFFPSMPAHRCAAWLLSGGKGCAQGWPSSSSLGWPGKW
eukprot:11199320-Lingulodinium_polyedra.AAC.1